MAEQDNQAKGGSQGQTGQVKSEWWKRPALWLGGVGTAGAIAIATAIGTNIGDKVATSATGNRAPVVSSPASPLSLGTSSKHSPLTIEDVSAGFFNYSSFVSSKKLALNSSQLASLVKAGSRPGGPAATGHYAMVNQEIIYVTVAGNSSAPVTIDDISVVKHCGLPLGRGATLFYSPAGAGSISTSPVYFDLDNPITSGRLLSKQTGKVYGNFFTHHVVTLKYQEPWTFVIYVTASAHYCQYHFNISIATANGPRTETINDHGLPFSLTSDGESMTTASHVRFSSYAAIYVTVRDSQGNLHFVRVNPKTYHGQPNPSPY